MSRKTLYDVLGVEQDATPEEIRAAYLLRARVLHPDRFDQQRQPTEWKLANEMLKELNQAYSTLRNSLDRADYDRTLGAESRPPKSTSPQEHRSERTQHTPPPRQNQNEYRGQAASPPPRPAVKLGKLRAGKAFFDQLPPSIQAKLRNRVTGATTQQLSVKVASVSGNYVLALLFAAYYYFILAVVSGNSWSSEEFWWLFAITFVVALLQGANTTWILNWHFSPLRCRLLITPLYIIKTHWNKVSFWPLWELAGMNATHKYTNGSYQGTELTLSFKADVANLKIYPEGAYDQMREAMRAFTNKIQSAREQQDWQYFYDQDDFRQFDANATPKVRTQRISRRTTIAFSASFFLSAVVFGIAATKSPIYTSGSTPPKSPTLKQPRQRHPNNNARNTTVSSPSIIARPQLNNNPQEILVPPSLPVRPQTNDEPQEVLTPSGALAADINSALSKPVASNGEQPLPEQGPLEMSIPFASDQGITAPLKVSTRPSDGHYVMKVVDWNTGVDVASFFIHAGSTLSIEVPLGSYKLKFANGESWYGMERLFGPRTRYSYIPDKLTFSFTGDYAQGHRIELIPQIGGNLDTRRMSAADW